MPSSPQAITAVIRNDAQMACLPAISVTPQAAAGKVKILAVSTAKRSPYLPDVPTLKETGIDVEADAWNGLIAPGGTPKAIIDKINQDVVEIIRQPAVRAQACGAIDGAGRLDAGGIPRPHRRRDRALGAGDQGGECESELIYCHSRGAAKGREPEIHNPSAAEYRFRVRRCATPRNDRIN